MKQISRTIKIELIVLAVLVAMVGIYFAIAQSQVTSEEANQASREHVADVKAKIGEVSGYTIVKEGDPTVSIHKDELGSDDYGLGAYFLVKKNDTSTSDDRAAISELAQRLPSNDYGIEVTNTATPNLLCVSAGRYLNNEGDYIPQGPTDNVARYIQPEEFSSDSVISSCASLLAAQ